MRMPLDSGPYPSGFVGWSGRRPGFRPESRREPKAKAMPNPLNVQSACLKHVSKAETMGTVAERETPYGNER